MLTKDIATALCARLDGDGAIEIIRIVHPAQATGASDLALAMTADAATALATTSAQAVVVSAAGAAAGTLQGDHHRRADADHARHPDGAVRFRSGARAGIHPTAVVAADAALGEGVSIGPYAVIGARSRIGAAYGHPAARHDRGRRRHRCRWADPCRAFVSATAPRSASG